MQGDKKIKQFDVVIVGAGMVGASLAIALSGHGLSIALVEASEARTETPPSYDDRTLALSHASCQILKALEVWPALTETTPIKRIRTSEKGAWGTVRMDAAEMGFKAFGHIVYARVLGQGLLSRLEQCDDVEWFQPARVEAIAQSGQGNHLQIKTAEGLSSIFCKLLVGADGTHSSIRKLLNIPTDHYDYQQSAVITNVTPEKNHEFTAFERLTQTGPLALLPLTEGRCGVVWCVETDAVEGMLTQSDEAFLSGLQSRFGYTLGVFSKVGKRAAYPLLRVRPQEQVWHRAVLIGNAVHAIHPLSAQGFNLGVRDVAVLAEELVKQQRKNQDIADPVMLKNYAAKRQPDHDRMINWSDGMVRLYRNTFFPVKVARKAGLNLIDVCSPLKRQITQMTMGLKEHHSALVRGEKL